MSTTIEMEPTETTAVAVRDSGGAVDKAMSLDELKANLAFVRDVMREVMTEDQDYGKIPGTPKPTLLQPGAQKLLMTFNLTEKVKKEEVTNFPGTFHREYAFTIAVTSHRGKEWDGVGSCSTLEAKYRWRKANRKCPVCGKETVIKGKAEYGGGWLCWQKEGKSDGCGAKWPDGTKEIESQDAGKVEHDNPADFWNTVRKMAFKRALVHAAINATNTSELWTQDMEETAQPAENAPGRAGNAGGAPTHTQAPKTPPTPKPAREAGLPKTVTHPDVHAKVLRSPDPSHTEAQHKEAIAFGKRCLAKFIGKLDAHQVTAATGLARDAGWLLPNELIGDLPVSKAPLNEGEHDQWLENIDAHTKGEFAAPPSDDPASGDPAWRDFPVPYGKNAGKALGELSRNSLKWYWENHTVNTEYNGKRLKAETIQKAQDFRDALDEAGAEFDFGNPDEEDQPF